MEILGVAISLFLLIILAIPKAKNDIKIESALAKDDYAVISGK